MTSNEEIEKDLEGIETDILFDLIKNSDDPNLIEAMKDPLLIAKLLYSEEVTKKVQEIKEKMIQDRKQFKLTLEIEKIKLDIQKILSDAQKEDLPF